MREIVYLRPFTVAIVFYGIFKVKCSNLLGLKLVVANNNRNYKLKASEVVNILNGYTGIGFPFLERLSGRRPVLSYRIS